MPLNQSFVGREYPPTPPYLVTREKILEFAQAIGAPEPEYRDPDAARASGHPEVVAPPTFPIALTLAAGDQFFADPELGLDFSRVVHGDQRLQYARPVVAGDRLRCVCALESITTRAGNDFVTTRTQVRDDRDDLVVTVWSMLVVRGEVEPAEGSSDPSRATGRAVAATPEREGDAGAQG